MPPVLWRGRGSAPLPSSYCEWASDELPDDWYAIPEVPGPEEVDQIIADALAAEQSGASATPAA